MNTTIYSQDSLLQGFVKQIQTLLNYIVAGHYDLIWEGFRKRLYSNNISIGLRRDLMEEFEPPDAAADISIVPLKRSYDATILKDSNLNQMFPKLVKDQKELLDANIPKCYMAVTNDDTPCYMQWLIGPQHNHLIQNFFGDSFPILNKNEALLEGALMNYSFKGNGIMAAAMSGITAEGHKLGVRWVLTFVDMENIPSLKASKQSGFSPYTIKRDKWFLFQHNVSFDALTEDSLEKYQEITGDRKEYNLKSFQLL